MHTICSRLDQVVVILNILHHNSEKRFPERISISFLIAWSAATNGPTKVMQIAFIHILI